MNATSRAQPPGWPPVRWRLIALRDPTETGCVAEFEHDGDGSRVTVQFDVDNRDEITTVWPEPNVFDNYNGTAEEVRNIVGAVTSFWRVAQMRHEHA
jgi:hypothetical protein